MQLPDQLLTLRLYIYIYGFQYVSCKTGVGKWLHALPSHPILDERERFSGRTRKEEVTYDKSVQ